MVVGSGGSYELCTDLFSMKMNIGKNSNHQEHFNLLKKRISKKMIITTVKVNFNNRGKVNGEKPTVVGKRGANMKPIFLFIFFISKICFSYHI